MVLVDVVQQSVTYSNQFIPNCIKIMSEKATPTHPEAWVVGFNELFVKNGKLYGNHLEVKDYIKANFIPRSTLQEVVANELESLTKRNRFLYDESSIMQSLVEHSEITGATKTIRNILSALGISDSK